MPTPTSWSSADRAPLSSRADANSLIDGQRWASASVSYSFATLASTWSTDPNTGYGPRTDTSLEPWSAGYGTLTEAQRTAVRGALAAWSNVSGLRFTEVAETASAVGDLRFAFGDLSDAQAWAYTPSNAAIAGDVWFNTGSSSHTEAWTPGSYEYETALHEIGHALGFKHPFDDGSFNTTHIAAAQDTRSLTVMSYSALPGRTDTWYSYEPTTPMLLDIVAMQTLYGTNRQYNATATTYAFSGTASYHQTIWDGGGSDTLRYDSASGGLLDLREGQASRLGLSVDIESSDAVLQRGVKNVWIAYGTVIENATGGSGADEIIGNDAANQLTGGAGNDSISAGAGNDTLDGGAGNDALTGGSGNDLYIVDALSDSVSETSTTATEIDTVQSSVSWTLGPNLELLVLTGTAALNGSGNALANRITGNAAANVLAGAGGNDSLDGGAGADSLGGGADHDTLRGGAGNDSLDGGAGNDVLDGGADTDLATYAGATAAVTVSLLLTTAQNTGGAGTDTLTAIENLTGSAFNDALTGNGANNLLNGGAGHDSLSGGTGNDSLLGGTGLDRLDGGAGNDSLDGGADTDTATYAAATAAVSVSLLPATAQNTGGAGTDTLTAIENLTGSAFNDRLTGSSGANVLDGGTGADTLLGGAGNDTLLGGAGADLLDGDAGNDVLTGGADADTASYAGATAAVSVSLLLATAQNTGGAGSDTLGAIENLTGSAYNDRLTGNTAANLLQGGAGNDTLDGGAGNDTLLGGSGLDSLSGGAGADVFDFNALTDSTSTATSCDVITDFSAAQGDRLDLRDIDADPSATQAGVQHFTGVIALSVAFSAPGQLHFDAATGLLTANTDTDAAAELALKLTGVTSLAAGSLWLA